MAAYNTRLLTPPAEEEEVYPYRRVWRSIIIEYGTIFGLAAGLFVLMNFLGIALPAPIVPVANIVIVGMPVLLWLIFSRLPEQSVPQPRERLFLTFIASALVANAVGIPLIEGFFLNNHWLSLSSAIDRIIGYTFTVGIVHEGAKYIILRYLVWSDHLRTRLDAVAYMAAAALGYALVMNLRFIAVGSPDPDVVALQVFSTSVLHMASGVVVSYGIAESRFSNANPFLLPLTFALACFITGVAVPVRSGFVNATVAVAPVAAPRPIFGLGFSLALLIGVLVVAAFLYNNAERQEIEMRIGREE